jgi:threonine-phosphate decarboxylase
VHGGKVYEYAETDGIPVESVFDFSANIHPLGPPKAVLQAIRSALPLIRHYPDARHRRVKEVLSERFFVPVESLVCGNGASEVMELIVRTLKPERTWILEPAFREYEAIALRIGSKVMRLSLLQNDTFALPLEELSKYITKGDLVVINTPHNPSGLHFPKSSWFETVRSWTKRGVHVLVDESFLDFMENDSKESSMHESVINPCWHTIRSATKFFSIPGLRFGFAVLHPDVAKRVNENRDGWSVNTIAQVAAIAAYQEQTWHLQTQNWLSQAKIFVETTWGSDSHIHLFPFDVNFFLIRLEHDNQSLYIQRELRRKGVYVRNCSTFHNLSAAYIRIAIRTETENRMLWTMFSDLLKGTERIESWGSRSM